MNIGVLNSGGDSPGLNAVIEGVVGAASRRGWNVVGFYDGFEGLLSEEGDERFEWLTPAACRGLRAKGGTILGTVNKGNFAIKVGVDQKGAIEPAVLEKTKATVRRLGLDPDRCGRRRLPVHGSFAFRDRAPRSWRAKNH